MKKRRLTEIHVYVTQKYFSLPRCTLNSLTKTRITLYSKNLKFFMFQRMNILFQKHSASQEKYYVLCVQTFLNAVGGRSSLASTFLCLALIATGNPAILALFVRRAIAILQNDKKSLKLAENFMITWRKEGKVIFYC